MDLKFYLCQHCKNLITKIHDAGVPVVCCGEKMQELIPNTTEAANEKHLPVAEMQDDKLTVTVGSVEHPMTEEHYIQWICVQTETGYQLKHLTPTSRPVSTFLLGDEQPVAVFAYCNLHGLWKTDLKKF